MYSYGLDLGLNSSCIATQKSGFGIKVIELFGKTTMPSFVYYDKNTNIICVGDVARNTVGVNKYTLLFDSKKYIGKKWLMNREKDIKYEIVHNNKTMYVSPVDIASEIIEYIDSQAIQVLSDERLSKNKYNVAIGVPSSFTYRQREATKLAAEKAGLKNIYLIPEPIAAVLGYIGENIIQCNRCYIIVYELRRNYFKASIVKCENNEFGVLNERQDDNIGGQKFTDILVDYYIQKVLEEDCDSKIRKSEKKMKRVKEACENAKINLTLYDETTISAGDDGLEVDISRSFFEELISKEVNKTIDIVNDLISQSNLRKADIEYSILVGGSCLLQTVRMRLSNFTKVMSTINPDEVVAKGCAHYACSLEKYIIKYSLPRSLSFQLTIKDLPSYSYGIDLGTTFSCASFISSGKSEMISPHSSTSTNSFPSCVSYSEDFSVVVGSAAENMKMRKSNSFIYDAKRFIGLNYDEIDEDEIKSYPFKLVKKEQIPVYNIQLKERIVSIFPMDVESEIIRYIHKYSMNRIFTIPSEINIRDILVVIGIPALFTNRQRESTIEAAKQAGLVNVQLIAEPVAALLGFLEKNEITKRKNTKIMVYDFGGGTFDVTIINLDNDNIEILETNGDSHLGGEDITRKLEEYVINDIKKLYNINAENNYKLKMRIHSECEKAKIVLSESDEYYFDISVGDEDYSERIARVAFNELCKSIFQRTIDVLDITLNKCNLKPNDIDYIILVGGSSRIPAIEGYIKGLFKRDGIICKSVNPDEAVAIGCAIYAKSLYSDEFSRYKIHNKFISYSEDGMDIVDEEMIKRFSQHPCKERRKFHCKEGFRQIQIYESDEYNHYKRHLIDSIELNVIEECEVEVEFELDERGDLIVTVRCGSHAPDVYKYLI